MKYFQLFVLFFIVSFASTQAQCDQMTVKIDEFKKDTLRFMPELPIGKQMGAYTRLRILLAKNGEGLHFAAIDYLVDLGCATPESTIEFLLEDGQSFSIKHMAETSCEAYSRVVIFIDDYIDAFMASPIKKIRFTKSEKSATFDAINTDKFAAYLNCLK